MKLILNEKKQESKEILHIACAIDDTFSYPLSVLLVSLFENNKDHNIKIHLFSATLSNEIIEELNELTDLYNQQFIFYKIQKKFIFNDLPINQRISIAAYYRLLIPEIICPFVERYLYLDADIIVVDDISGIFELDLKGKVFGAVNDIVGIEKRFHIKHNIPENYLYFNSGVLLVDKTAWLKTNVTNRTFDYLDNNKGICKYHDQDALNGALFMERYFLPPIWNQLIDIYYIPKKILLKSYSYNEIIDALNQPRIIHFNGPEKPWNFDTGHPFANKFYFYSKKVKGYKKIQKWNYSKKTIVYSLFGWKNINKFYYYKNLLDKPEENIESII